MLPTFGQGDDVINGCFLPTDATVAQRADAAIPRVEHVQGDALDHRRVALAGTVSTTVHAAPGAHFFSILRFVGPSVRLQAGGIRHIIAVLSRRDSDAVSGFRGTLYRPNRVGIAQSSSTCVFPFLCAALLKVCGAISCLSTGISPARLARIFLPPAAQTLAICRPIRLFSPAFALLTFPGASVFLVLIPSKRVKRLRIFTGRTFFLCCRQVWGIMRCSYGRSLLVSDCYGQRVGTPRTRRHSRASYHNCPLLPPGKALAPVKKRRAYGTPTL